MNIFVSNLGCHVESADLHSFFAPFGAVTSAKVINDKETGKSLRYGFVDMPDEKAASEAIGKLNGRIIEGRAMSIRIAKGKERDINLKNAFTSKRLVAFQ